MQNNSSTQLLKAGLYDFDADRGIIRVFDGKAEVQIAGQHIEVKSGQQVALNAAGKLKERKFDKKTDMDDFYRWASLRASYLAEANVDQARMYAGGRGWSPPAFMGTDGIGTLRLTPIRSFRMMASSSIRSAGASTHHGMRMELRTLDTDTAGSAMVATATAVSATVDISGRDTIRATQPVAALPGPLHTRTTFVVLASLASAAAGVSAAEGSTEVPAAAVSTEAAVDSMAVAADSMAAGEADTARTTMSRLFERHTESIPEGCADSVSRAGFCDGFRSYTG